MKAELLDCWCGNDAVEPAATTEYLRCTGCGTLRDRAPLRASSYLTPDSDGCGFYGASYWRQRVPARGLPSLEERAGSDLNERAPYYLEKILRHGPIAGPVLDLGCAPGALTYLLQCCGAEVLGVEMSAEIARAIEDRFGVEVAVGPLERLAAGRYRRIVAVDLLEHLVDPLGTLRLCRQQLDEDGILFLQTPCYRGEDDSWPMFLPSEHLYLFDESSVTRLLEAAGFGKPRIEDSLFPYDMWVTASANELEPSGGSTASRSVLGVESVSPLLAAHLDLVRESRRSSEERLRIEVEADARAELLARQQVELSELRGDHHARGEQIDRLTAAVVQLREDQAEKEKLIRSLSAEIEELRKDQLAKGESLDRLTVELRAVEEDRAEKDDLVARLSRDLEAIATDRRAKQDVVDRLHSRIAEIEEDRSAKDRELELAARELRAIAADRQAKQYVVDRLQRRLAEVEGDRVEKDRALERAGRELEAIAADRRAKQEVVESLQQRISEIEEDRRAKQEVVHRFEERLTEAEEDRRAKQELLERVSAELAEVREDQRQKEEVIADLLKQHERDAATLAAARSKVGELEAALAKTLWRRLGSFLRRSG